MASAKDLGSKPEASGAFANHGNALLTEAELKADLTNLGLSFEPEMPSPTSDSNGSPAATTETTGVTTSGSSTDSAPPTRYSISDLQGMNDSELRDVLRQSWDCGKKLEVWGELAEVVTADKELVKLTVG